MAAAPAPADAKAEAAKMDLLEDDDEFEEFEIDQGTRTRPSSAFGCAGTLIKPFGRVDLIGWLDGKPVRCC
jgi:hypothetical protein